MTNGELVDRQMFAGYALLAQSTCFILIGALQYFSLLSSFIALDFLGTLIAYIAFVGPAYLPFDLGVGLFRGKFVKWALDGWVGFSICVAFLIGLALFPILPYGIPLPHVPIMLILAATASLLVAHFVYKFTGLYSDLTRYQQGSHES